MRRVVPSQVVKFIKNLPNYTFPGQGASMNHVGAPALSSVLDLVGQVPDELLTMSDGTYEGFVLAKASIRDVLEVWIANRNAGHAAQNFRFGIPNDPLAIIRDALIVCPDEAPAPSTSELTFISDPDFRTNLRNDIGAINRALSDGEWKAATVLAGSAIEALLLWALQQRLTAIPGATASLCANQTLTRQPDPNPERWDLHEYTEVAANLGIIESDTATETRLARGFRNLIHPGRAQRLGQKCDRGTALSCVAALEHVVRDLA